MKVLGWLTAGFPVWALIASLLSLWHPPLFTWFTGIWIPVGLGLIMLGMGLTLSWEDFRRVTRFPQLVFYGLILQYTVMPFMGLASAWLYALPVPLAVGLILVASCPGGVASNVISYLAKADVALSVTMTAFSTVIAVVMTPLLTAWLAGSRIEVPVWGLLRDTAGVVILPIALGLLLKRFFPRATRRVLPAAPLMAVVLIVLIVASIIGAGKKDILEAGLRLLLAVFTLHAGGFFFGYAIARLLSRKEIAARTISIEVGMQNSGLGVVLARQNFADPLFAIPSAISSLFHSLIASLLAAVWRRSAWRHEERPAGPPADPLTK